MKMYKIMEKVDIHGSESLCIVFYHEYYNWSYVQGWTVALSVSVSQHVYMHIWRGGQGSYDQNATIPLKRISPLGNKNETDYTGSKIHY